MKYLSIIILTKDEALNLPHCLKSLQGLDAEIFIVDSGSVDRTAEIARQAGCQVVEHPFENQAKQFNWALEKLPLKTPWIMRLDADEKLTAELVQELNEVLLKSPPEISGYQIKRRVFFMGRWIKHGGYYPTWLLRVWRAGSGICEDRWMDEHIVLHNGMMGRLKNDIVDENFKGLSFWIDKHNRYASREVADLMGLQRKTPNEHALPSLNAQAAQRRWLKVNLYGKAPLFLRAILYFIYRYFFLAGFLDGVEGFIFHFLQGFWYRFLVDAKLYEKWHTKA